MHTVNSTGRDHTRMVSRMMYALFVLLSAYFLVFKGDVGDGAANLGIALIFDPFDPKQPWKERPLFQRAWLVVHALAVLVLFSLQLFR